MSSLRKVLVGLRTEKGWSQAKLAEEAGVSVDWVKKVETGRTAAPYTTTLRKVADALGVPASELTEAVQYGQSRRAMQPHPEQSEDLMASFMGLQRLTPRRLRETRRMIEMFADMDEQEFQSGRPRAEDSEVDV